MLRITYQGPSPDEIRRRMNDAVRRATDAHLREVERVVRQVRCPVHHRSVSVTRFGDKFRISGCCPLVVQLASRIAGS